MQPITLVLPEIKERSLNYPDVKTNVLQIPKDNTYLAIAPDIKRITVILLEPFGNNTLLNPLSGSNPTYSQVP
jgi:hypothetical protein